MIPSNLIDRARAVPIQDLLARWGKSLPGKKIKRNGACPRCAGTDRFSIDTKKQVWFCRHCAKGGGVIELVMNVDGVSFREAVEKLSGNKIEQKPSTKRERHAEPDNDENTARALSIWKEARHPRGTLVDTYLAHRCLILPDEAAGEAIRFHPACPFKDARTPAMVALVRDVRTNEPKAIHRTALDASGCKAWIDGNDRMSLGPVSGGAVKLTPDQNVTLCLGIGEGIESTLSMRFVPEFGASPIWSLLSAGQLDHFPVLPGIKTLWIATDHDDAGIKAARSCAERWHAARREVFLIKSRHAGDDLNDIARRSA